MEQILHKKEEGKSIYRWFYVVLGMLIMMCLGTVYSWSVFRLSIEKMFNVGATESGFPYMTALAFYALFMFLSGRFLDRYSPKRIILFGSFLVSMGWILSSFAPNIYVLTVTYGMISGAGVGIVYGVPMSVTAKWFPEKKGLAVGLVLVGFGLSPLITAPLARNLVEMNGVMNTFLILGVSFGLIIPLLSIPFKYPSEGDEKSDSLENCGEREHGDILTSKMVKTLKFKGLYISFMIGTMMGLMVIGMTSKVGIELISLSPKEVTMFISIFAIFNGAGRPLFGWFTDKFSSRRAMLLSFIMIMSAAGLMLFAKEGSLILFGISFSIFWFNLGGWLAIAPASAITMFGSKHYSQNYGVIFTAYGIGAILGVVSSGLLLDALGNYESIFYFIIGLCVTGILISQKMIKD